MPDAECRRCGACCRNWIVEAVADLAELTEALQDFQAVAERVVQRALARQPKEKPDG